MIWRPGIHGGELDAVAVKPQIRSAGFEAQAALARIWAIAYWERAASLPTLRGALRSASAANAENLREG